MQFRPADRPLECTGGLASRKAGGVVLDADFRGVREVPAVDGRLAIAAPDQKATDAAVGFEGGGWVVAGGRGRSRSRDGSRGALAPQVMAGVLLVRVRESELSEQGPVVSMHGTMSPWLLEWNLVLLVFRAVLVDLVGVVGFVGMFLPPN
jgi:hypothetical protein